MSLLAHEEVAVRRGRRSGIYIVVSIHSTALGPALGGLRMWRYAALGDAIADGRARPRRRQGSHLPPAGSRAAAR